MKTRQLVYFQGHVQGVGFRYTTRRLAAGFPVTGFVRNLPDGRVELVAEGDRDDVRRFVTAVQETLRDHVRHADVHDLPATDEFAGFDIRY